MSKLKDKIIEVGIEKCRFIVPMRPLQSVFGLFAYTSSSDEEQNVLCEIDEDRYQINKDYKITLKSLEAGYGSTHFYIQDLSIMINDGRITFLSMVDLAAV